MKNKKHLNQRQARVSHQELTDQIRGMVYLLFAAPSSGSEDLEQLAAWIRANPVLLPDEKELLANSAQLRAMVLELAAEGDSCAVSELIWARNQWYMRAIAEAERLAGQDPQKTDRDSTSQPLFKTKSLLVFSY